MEKNLTKANLEELAAALRTYAESATHLADTIQKILENSSGTRTRTPIEKWMPIEDLLKQARIDFPEFTPNVFTIIGSTLDSVRIRRVCDLQDRMQEKGRIFENRDRTSAYWKRLPNFGNVTLSALGKIIVKYDL